MELSQEFHKGGKEDGMETINDLQETLVISKAPDDTSTYLDNKEKPKTIKTVEIEPVTFSFADALKEAMRNE